MDNAEKNVYKGLPLFKEVIQESVGVQIYRNLKNNINLKRPLIIDETNNISLSCKQILNRSCGIAQWLKENGVKRNEIISVCSENSVHFFMPVLAALYSGFVVASINHTYSEGELLHALTLTKPKIAFCSKATYPKFLHLFRKNKIPFVEKFVILEGLKDTLSNIKVNSFEPIVFDPNEQLAVILYSSGTTGLPKGVMISHANINLRHNHSLDPRIRGASNNTNNFIILPFYHAYGFMISLGTLQNAFTLIFLQKFEEKAYLNCIQKYKIEELTLVPPLMIFLAKHPIVDKYDLSSVKLISSGAACLSKDIEEAVKRRLKVDMIRQGYGLTETTLGVAIGPLQAVQKPGSSGTVVPGLEMVIRDPETGCNLPHNQLGEICIKGGLVMKGYYNNPEATKAAFSHDGYLLTGDLGYFDQDEYIYVIDRLKELIKYNGFQVPPAELEALLLTNPNIKDAAVIGLPDESAGELPFAFVVKQPNVTKLTELEVIEFVAKRVSSHKKLRGGVKFIKEIPRNASGKILRRELKKLIPTLIKAKL